MLTGVDRAWAITPAEARRLATEYGIDWCCVYIGGPTSGGEGWTVDVVEALAAAATWRFLPTYVGRNLPWSGFDSLNAENGEHDGREAVAIMEAWGWPGGLGLSVCLDVEYDTFVGNPDGSVAYMLAWARVVALAGYWPVIYAPPQGLNAYARVAEYPSGCWAAIWLYPPGSGSESNVQPDPRQIEGLRTVWTHYAWQYTGGTWLPGFSSDFDLSTADEAFPFCPAPSRVQLPEKLPVPVFFPQTGCNLGGAFLEHWQQYGGVVTFGYPLTNERQEEYEGAPGWRELHLPKGWRLVQYFERGKLVFFPEHQAPWRVQGADLGRVALAARG